MIPPRAVDTENCGDCRLDGVLDEGRDGAGVGIEIAIGGVGTIGGAMAGGPFNDVDNDNEALVEVGKEERRYKRVAQVSRREWHKRMWEKPSVVHTEVSRDVA